ncbi:hypothetical protein BN946_scf184939.g78 [Trametes cinnabarina]|uniref:Tc1-like transposase DDE domain-containing protein n=1 Tax=Pycnoporus cinnabarinus TaxID=5643 RepID=A0A060SI22_PYCCI|nr:hypothetical protein BN946_scf184939.g78 [Trametes cinnabarina]
MHIAENYQPEQLVFVDETHLNRETTRRMYGWAQCGRRAHRREFFIRGQRYSILPALSLDGIIALDVFETSLTAEKFTLFIEMVLDCMNPFPQRNSVLVMDNPSIHHAEGLRELVEARGMRLEYLPTYSPDLNPIEEAFSSIKAWIRSNRDYALSEMLGDEAADPYILIYDAVFTVTAEKARGWFMHSGYL